MTFPAIGSVGLTAVAVTDPWIINLPASISAGDLLLLFISNNSANTPITPSGWTSLLNTGNGVSAFYKYASGSEGATVSVGSGGIRSGAAVCYRITGTDGSTAPALSATAITPASATFDPPSLTPSWGSDDTLWLAISAEVGGSHTVSAGPTGYTLQNNQVGTGSSSAIHAYARTNAAASEDPSAFTLSGTALGSAITVGIRPPASANAFYAFNAPMLGM